VDSSQAVVASTGVFQNLTSYLNGTFGNLTSAIFESSEYFSEALGIPPSLLYGSLGALIAVPLTMSRYGWASSREQISPYSSMGGGPPAVTDDDFSYITSQDLDDPSLDIPGARGRHATGGNPPEDDVLLLKNRGVTYPAHFPAYAIGDGKLRVKDVKDRAGLLMELSERATHRIRLLYKGKQLKDSAAPVRDYGVKNKSELIVMAGDMDDGSSPSDEETVIVPEGGSRKSKSSKKGKKRSKTSKSPRNDRDADSTTSPRDSNSTFEPMGSPQSPQQTGPMEKLDEIAGDLKNKWLPLCNDYIADPPTDIKKREEEHRRLSESLLQHIILKLDGVETEGIAEVRTRRKALVTEVQNLLKTLDVTKASK
jgi:hypothetical protein